MIAYIYNGHGQYEEKDGEKGITLTHGGEAFWLPYNEVTAFPNYNLKVVDHDKSTGTGGQMVGLVYENVRVSGDRLVEELTKKQVPYTNHDMGIIKVVGTPTGKVSRVKAGVDAADNSTIWEDVPEVVATDAEKALAASLSKRYKERAIADYFQSKRERMSGGKGQLQPSDQIRLYMDEFGVKDLDDVENRKALTGGLDPQVMAAAMAMAMQILEAQKAEKELEAATRP